MVGATENCLGRASFSQRQDDNCLSKQKCLHMMNPGDVLVDDYLRYRELWEKAGGIFIHHVSVKESIRQLAALGLSVRRQTSV